MLTVDFEGWETRTSLTLALEISKFTKKLFCRADHVDFLEYLCFKENQRLLNYIFSWCAAGSFQASCLMVRMLFKIPFFEWGRDLSSCEFQ